MRKYLKYATYFTKQTNATLLMRTAATLRLMMTTTFTVPRDMAVEEHHTTQYRHQADKTCRVAIKNFQKEEQKLTGCERHLSAAVAVTSAPPDVTSHTDHICCTGL